MIPAGHSQRRADLLRLGAEFVRTVTQLPGVKSISLLGSICTDRQHPKDIDFLVVIGEDVDLARLAVYGRRLKGRAQGLGSGADIFLVNAQQQYIGRICHYRECWPRRTCQALHCGQTPHLNDDLEVLRLSHDTINSPPVTIWPELKTRSPLPTDVEDFLNRVVGSVDKSARCQTKTIRAVSERADTVTGVTEYDQPRSG